MAALSTTTAVPPKPRRGSSVGEAIEHYDGMLAAAGRLGLGDADPRCAQRPWRGPLRFAIGDLDGARPDFETAIGRGARGRVTSSSRSIRLLGLVALLRSMTSTRATELIEATGPSTRTECLPSPGSTRSPALAIQYVQQLRLDRAAEIGERALALALAEGDRRSLSQAKDALKLVAQQLGDVGRLEELTDDCCALRERPRTPTTCRGSCWSPRSCRSPGAAGTTPGPLPGGPRAHPKAGRSLSGAAVHRRDVLASRRRGRSREAIE